MFSAMLRVQWIWSRAIMLFFLAAGFALPLVMVPIAGPGRPGWASASTIVDAGGTVGLMVAIAVALAAVSLVLQNWSADERGRHIYALSLPIDRRRYLLYRLVGGFILLGLMSGAIWLGGLATAGLVELPSSLRAYPGALALRALLAALVVHALAFVVRFGAGRKTRLALFGLVVGACVLLVLPPGVLPSGWNWVQVGVRALTSDAGPFGILVGHWSFIDV